MLKKYLHQILNQSSLTQEEAEAAMSGILEGADPLQVAAFLSILRYRGETVEEVTGMVGALEKKAVSVQLPHPTLDIVDTSHFFLVALLSLER